MKNFILLVVFPLVFLVALAGCQSVREQPKLVVPVEKPIQTAPSVRSLPIAQPQLPPPLQKKLVEPSTESLPEELEPFLLDQQPDLPNEEMTVTPLPVTPVLPPKVRAPSVSIEFIGLPPAMVQLLMQADKEKKKRNYVAASVSIERALRIQPKSAVAYKRLAEIHLAQGRYAEAEQWARKAVQYANFSPYTRTLQFRNSVNALLLRAQSGR